MSEKLPEDNFPAAPRLREAELTLRSGTDNNLAHINIGRLLDRERNGAGDCIRWNRKAVHRGGDLPAGVAVGTPSSSNHARVGANAFRRSALSRDAYWK